MKKELFTEFQDVSAKAWKQKIQYDLKGADYNEKLVWESPEGIKVKPFYHLDDVKSLQQKIGPPISSWKIAQRIFVADALRANKKALNSLKGGVDTLLLTIPSEKIGIEKLLSNLDLNTTDLHFEFQFLSESYIERILSFLKDSEANVYFNLDILGHLAQTGNWFDTMNKDWTALKNILKSGGNQKNRNVVSIDIALYQNAGAHIVQQLAYAMAHINEYLNQCENRVIQNPVFTIAVGGNYFFEIAKIRALRKLWTALSREYGVSGDCHIVATPSRRNKTIYDYNTNMLRSTTECMSAVLGGADTICNLPYDIMYHKDNGFAERIARNQLLLLKHESYFDKAGNSAEGSYYIETITEQIAEKALYLFKQIEAGGGFLQQLKGHLIQRKIRENALKEQRQFDLGNEILVGTNAFKNPSDSMSTTLEIYPFVKKKERKTLIEPIIARRLAEEVEQKRLKEEGWSGS